MLMATEDASLSTVAILDFSSIKTAADGCMLPTKEKLWSATLMPVVKKSWSEDVVLRQWPHAMEMSMQSNAADISETLNDKFWC